MQRLRQHGVALGVIPRFEIGLEGSKMVIGLPPKRSLKSSGRATLLEAEKRR
jgi:hypothetical protein